MKISSIVLAAMPFALSLGLAQCASAEILFSNGPVDGTISAYDISRGFAISDSFTLANASTLDDVSFGGWALRGGLSTLDWSIGTTPFGVDGAAVTPTSVTDGLPIAGDGGSGGYTVEEDSFSLGGLTLGPGEYYLTLQNATNSGGGLYSFWDVNNGTESDAQTQYITNPPSDLADGDAGPGSGSESFTILGEDDSLSIVPEPTGWVPVLLGAAFLGFFVVRRKKLA